MTVSELKLFIKNLPDDMEVIMQKDGEGNYFSPLYTIDADCRYVPDNTWSGEIIRNPAPEYDKCLLLIPIN